MESKTQRDLARPSPNSRIIYRYGFLLVALALVLVLMRALNPIQKLTRLPGITGSDSTAPILIYPQDGTLINTLIPEFQWYTGELPPDTYGCLSYSTQPGAVEIYQNFGPEEGRTGKYQLWDSLAPDTTFYWKVGIVSNADESEVEWSEEWSFTTPSVDKVLPAPSLISPEHNALVDTSEWVFRWSAVEDAKEYQFTLKIPAENITIGFLTSDTQAVNHLGETYLKPGTVCEWNIRPRNDYGWGELSETWRFQVASN